MRNVCTAFVVIDPSNPWRSDAVILRPPLSAVPPCSLASLQWWQFLSHFGSLLLDLIVLVMTLPNVGAKNTFPAAACAYCCSFCLINCWSPARFIIPPYPCRNRLLFFLVFTILNKQNLFGFIIWSYKDMDSGSSKGDNAQCSALYVLITQYLFICGAIEPLLPIIHDINSGLHLWHKFVLMKNHSPVWALEL